MVSGIEMEYTLKQVFEFCVFEELVFCIFKYKLLNCLFSFVRFESKAKVKTFIFNLFEML